ncbi:aspartate/glutamate racemase family protein [soil metagenome]
MKILILNVNTSPTMTEEIAAAARAAAAPGTQIVARMPLFGAEAVDSVAESYLSAVGVTDYTARLLDSGEFDFDAVVLAGFGEHGKDALQEMLTVPVLDIAEAAAHVAQLVGRRFSVVTTLARSIPAIEDRLLLAGLSAHCASVRACGLGTAEVDADPDGAVDAIVAEAAKALDEDGADVICLGCAGMAGVTAAISERLGVPAIDGVAAAVALAQALVGLGLSTSKAGMFAPGPSNPRSHWPLSTALGLETLGLELP